MPIAGGSSVTINSRTQQTLSSCPLKEPVVRLRLAILSLIAILPAITGCGQLSVRYNDPSDPFSQCCQQGGRGCRTSRGGAGHSYAAAAASAEPRAEDPYQGVPGAKFHPVPVRPVFERQP